ncbi:putative structural protein [Xanthomonas phage FoX7]|uniref:Uncharacterized protein n=2 Tax=Carpasinavirus XcP1 TaxID=2182344 RepID=A0A858NY13_9CAUD|nr:hypothetical protein XccvBFoX6_gp19 [Xanthomonas phage FoX6]QJB22176.1 putative structural protein [Xanthomonas phage FoX7]
MQNISGFGLSATVIASATFPTGFQVNAFADDASPIDTPDFELADTAMGLNGHGLNWSRPQMSEFTFNVIAGSDDDKNFEILFEANRIGLGKRSARDKIAATVNYPDGSIESFSEGVMVTGTIMPKISAAGRFETRAWRFRFQNKTKVEG